MNKKLVAVALISSAVVAIAANKKKDPVLMTIDKNNITLSEFEYLYNKNNTQQAQEISLDEYVDMFVNYKLKVADAIDEGIDTTSAYKQEFKKFREEIAAPYLRDAETEEALLQDAYNRLGKDVFVSHVMLQSNAKPGDDNKARLDSIRDLIVNGEITFEEAAQKYSIDKPSAVKGGRMGWVSSEMNLPIEFIEASYSTNVGEVSPVIYSGFGFHIVRPEEIRKSRGEVKAQHILMLTRGLDSIQAAEKKARIDSLYLVVTAPNADFSEIAKQYSEDPGSAKNGGDLGWFGAGRMVPEFEEAAFALEDGGISKPFATSYGYHIVKRNGHRGDTVPELDQVRNRLVKAMDNDYRHFRPMKVWQDKKAAQTKSSVNPQLTAQVQAFLAKNDVTVGDSAAIALLETCDIEAYNVAGKKTTVGEMVKSHKPRMGNDVATTAGSVNTIAQTALDFAMLDLGRDDLMKENEDYRNLINEYRDGILLFEVANRKVWDKASKDKEGLEKFFQAHRDNYKWDAPKYKAYVVFASNDSILQLAEDYAKKFDANTTTKEKFVADMKKEFGRDIKVERVIASEGENPITDYLGFNGAKPDNLNQRWSGYFAFDGHVVAAPEEASDLKGAVVTDYQSALEKEWLEELHKKHKVKINEKVLKQAK